MSSVQKIVIVGGVAGGASAATRARRLSEQASIVLLERGSFISFANCGMPYHLGGVIKDRDRLLVQTPEAMAERYRIDVRVNTEALSIDRARKVVRIRNRLTGETREEMYDALILSPGAEPIRPPLPGLNLPGIFTLRSLEDMDKIQEWLKTRRVSRALVVGGGFIGLEMTEAFRERGLEVALVEMAPQVLTQLDPEMAAPVHQQLKLHQVNLKLGVSVNGFSASEDRLRVQLSSGENLETDVVVLAIGVKPEVALAREAGLKIGDRGGIFVDEQMRTSDPSIFAVGDAVETLDIVGGQRSPVPLAGPANRQGRIAADNALGRPASAYRGSQGTSICKVFQLAAGSTGQNEKNLKRLGMKYRKIYVHPASHAGYYPGAHPLSLKLLFEPDQGRLLGAQVVGSDGVDKRLDVLAVALRARMTVFDLEHLELSYAPPYGSAKDPVNYAGFVASNALRGDLELCTPEELASPAENQLVLDVRTPDEASAGTIPGSLNIPIDVLRERIKEIPKGRELLIFCQVGLRSYLAARILQQQGWKTRVLTGGYTTYKAVMGMLAQETPVPPREIRQDANEDSGAMRPGAGNPEARISVTLDARGLQCPGPIIQLGRAMEKINPGEAVRIQVTDPGFLTDAPAWCHSTGHRCGEVAIRGDYYEAVIVKEQPVRAESSRAGSATKSKTIIVFSNDFDRVMSAFILANGAASMGSEVTLFFTFWGLNVLRRSRRVRVRKNLIERAFGWMMPRGPERLALTKMDFWGLGTALMRRVMKNKNVDSLPSLMEHARAAGVRLVACTMTMDIMGIKREELIPGVEEGGVASYLDRAEASGVNLFI